MELHVAKVRVMQLEDECEAYTTCYEKLWKTLSFSRQELLIIGIVDDTESIIVDDEKAIK